jgi:hypothetical protein
MFKKILPLFLIGIALSACTHSIHFSHMSDVLPGKQKGARYINVESQRHVFLGFIFNTNYVEEARQKLMAACPNAEITGINTKYITSHGFASYTDKIRIRALCLD